MSNIYDICVSLSVVPRNKCTSWHHVSALDTNLLHDLTHRISAALRSRDVQSVLPSSRLLGMFLWAFQGLLLRMVLGRPRWRANEELIEGSVDMEWFLVCRQDHRIGRDATSRLRRFYNSMGTCLFRCYEPNTGHLVQQDIWYEMAARAQAIVQHSRRSRSTKRETTGERISSSKPLHETFIPMISGYTSVPDRWRYLISCWTHVIIAET